MHLSSPLQQQQPTKSSNNAKPPTSCPANSTKAHPIVNQELNIHCMSQLSIVDTDREQIAAVLSRKWQPFPNSDFDFLLETQEHLDKVLASLTPEQERMILQRQFGPGPGSTGDGVNVVTKGVLFQNDFVEPNLVFG